MKYKFAEFNESYFACGLNSFLQPSSENDILCLTYNIYSGGLENNYPKSKNLKYKFHEIALIENEEQNSAKKVLEGDWEINIEVPEKMYNRQAINYKVIECSDENVLAMTPINSNYNPDCGETIEDCTYIENQNHEKFLISTNLGRIQKEEFINDDTVFVLYETFDLTKYNITDELTVHLKFYDKSISVKLKKMYR